LIARTWRRRSVFYGPVLESKFHGGFAGYYPIPISHAMTMGELANYYNNRFQIRADIEVVKLSGYKTQPLL
jgi:uncharacterized protein YbbC (DUF1343 family)